nr:hypothetical protein [Pseudomonas sp. 2FG]
MPTALLVRAVSALAIGTTAFVILGLLPEVAAAVLAVLALSPSLLGFAAGQRTELEPLLDL